MVTTMTKERYDQFDIQWRRLRAHDWYDRWWIRDDESSLSVKESNELLLTYGMNHNE